ncbi:hypothetical protein [Sorangium cellulosum]|uniref:hypothetical protein n=1 Tax=Sorangium cellulosum TaxID=56 RepID=UPI0012DB1EE5|nr:hypothetical protein [Sorangium cellulosum]
MISRSIVQYLGGPAKGPGIDVAGAAVDARGGGILCPGSPGAATAFAPRAGARRAPEGVGPPLGAGAADGSADGAGAAIAGVAALLPDGAPEAPATGKGTGALDDGSGAADAGALDGTGGAADSAAPDGSGGAANSAALDGTGGAPGADVALASTVPGGASRGTNSQ